MKIALACPYSWDAAGGVQVHVGQLARHLQVRGHTVLVLAPALAPDERPVEPWVRVVGRALRVPYQGTVAPICFSARSARRIAATLRSFAPDIVHVHEPLTPSTGMLAVLRARAPAVATFHAFAERSLLYSIAAPVLRPVWSRLRVRIAVSDAAARYVGSRFRDGIRIIPNGCDIELFAQAKPLESLPAGRRMVWVGRLDRQKGFPVAVQAFESLADDSPDLQLVVVGEGRDRAALDRVRPDVRKRVILAGSVPHQSLPPYLSGADAFVAPALGQESFGIVLVEAMAAGVPVVASDIPGYREVVRNGVDGILVPPGDSAAVADAIRRVLSDEDLSALLRQAGRARADRFSWDVVINEIESAYEDALSKR